MNKYLWGAAALIVAVAAGSYFFVVYALRHPDAAIVKYGVAMMYSSLQANPMRTAPTQVAAAPHVDVVEMPAVDEQEAPSWLPLPRGGAGAIEVVQIETVRVTTPEPPMGGVRQVEFVPDVGVPFPFGPRVSDDEGLSASNLPTTVPAKMPYAEECSRSEGRCLRDSILLKDYLNCLREKLEDALGSVDDEDAEGSLFAWILSQMNPTGCRTNEGSSEESESGVDNWAEQLGAYFGSMCWGFDSNSTQSDEDDQGDVEESEQLVDPTYHQCHQGCPFAGVCQSECQTTTQDHSLTPCVGACEECHPRTRPMKPILKLGKKPMKPQLVVLSMYSVDLWLECRYTTTTATKPILKLGKKSMKPGLVEAIKTRELPKKLRYFSK